MAQTIEPEPARTSAPSFEPVVPEHGQEARRLVDHGTIRLFGDVTAASSEPLDSSSTLVEAICENDMRSCGAVNGSYAIEGLAPGSYVVRCTSPDLRQEIRSVRFAPGEIDHREDFVLTSAWNVAIRLVTTDGRNFRDLGDQMLPANMSRKLIVVATPTAPPERWATAIAERDARRNTHYWPRRGQERVVGDPDGTCSGRLEILLHAPVYLSAEVDGTVIGTTHLDTEDTVATIVIDLAPLRDRAVR